MTSGALYLLIGAALGGLAALGVTIGACGLLISAADAVNSLSKAPFVETTQYHDPSYYGYKFVAITTMIKLIPVIQQQKRT